MYIIRKIVNLTFKICNLHQCKKIPTLHSVTPVVQHKKNKMIKQVLEIILTHVEMDIEETIVAKTR
jgi:hypothetical protein